MKLIRNINSICKNGIIAIIFFPFFLHAQGNITGKIIDKENGEPVAGAVIQIDSSFITAISDKDGRFEISGVRGNGFSITVSHISFKTDKRNIIPGNEINIELSRQSYLSEEVNISATRSEYRSSVAFTTITKDEIEKNNLGQDLPFLLSMTPSSVVTSDAGNGIGYTGIRIRGSDATRVNVSINGIPVNDAESHQVYWVDLPDLASSVEDIQIQRGVGNSTNGAGAFGGSINIQTNKLSVMPFANAFSSAGSFNAFKNTLSFGTGLLSDHFAMEGRFSMISSDGYIDRASSKLKSFNLSGGYYGKKNSVRLIALSGKEKTYQAWYGLPQDSIKTNRTYNPAGEYYDASGNIQYYDNQTDNYQQDYYQLLYSHEFNKSTIGNFALHYTPGKGYYEEYKADDQLANYNLDPITISDSTITSMDVVRQLWLSNHFYGLTWSVDYQKDKIKIKAGGAANKYEGDHFGEIIAAEISSLQQYPYKYYNDKATKTDISAFARLIYSPVNSIEASLDLQERIVDYSFEGLNDVFLTEKQNVRMNFFNPKVGFNYLISSQTQLYFSAGIGHKEPVRDDFVNSTPSNRPEAEYMIDYESGVRYNSENISFSVNGFYMDYKSQLILTGKINDVGEYIRESVENSYREGIEIEGAINITSQLNLRANISMSQNRIKLYREYVDDYDGGPQIVNEYTNTNISFSPSLNGAAVIGYNPFKNFNIELMSKYSGKQYLDNTTSEERKLNSFFINDLHLSYSIHPVKIKEITFQFSLNNFLNQEYISNGYTYSGFSNGTRYDYNYYFPQAKMNWMGGIVLKI